LRCLESLRCGVESLPALGTIRHNPTPSAWLARLTEHFEF
jgi:hypothetical protein